MISILKHAVIYLLTATSGAGIAGSAMILFKVIDQPIVFAGRTICETGNIKRPVILFVVSATAFLLCLAALQHLFA